MLHAWSPQHLCILIQTADVWAPLTPGFPRPLFSTSITGIYSIYPYVKLEKDTEEDAKGSLEVSETRRRGGGDL